MSDRLSNSDEENLIDMLNWEKEKTNKLEERLIAKETLISQMKLYNNDLCTTIQQNTLELEELRDLQEKDVLEIEALEEMIKEQRQESNENNPKLSFKEIDIDSVLSDYEFLKEENERLKKDNISLKEDLENLEYQSDEESDKKIKDLELEEKLIEIETEITNTKERNETLKRKYFQLAEEMKIVETEKELIAIRFQEQMREKSSDQSSLIDRLMKMKEESLIRTQSQIKRVDREIEYLKKEIRKLRNR